MSRKKQIDPERAAEADDLLLRALRQLADDALEEEIPERLLRPLREAQSRPGTTGERGSEAAGGTDGSEAARRRRGAGSA